MVDKSSAFSIDALLASDGSRSADNVAGHHFAVIDDDTRPSSNSTTADNAWLYQLFTNVARHLLTARSAANSGVSSMGRTKESDMDTTEQSRNSMFTSIESSCLRPRNLSSFVSNWLEQSRRSIHDTRSLSFDSRASVLAEHRSVRDTGELSHLHRTSDALHAASVDYSRRQERRPAEKNVVDRPQSAASDDVDAASRYFNEEIRTKVDGGTRAAWSTEFYRGVHGDCTASPRIDLYPSLTSTAGKYEYVERDYNAMLFWRIGHPLTGKVTTD